MTTTHRLLHWVAGTYHSRLIVVIVLLLIVVIALLLVFFDQVIRQALDYDELCQEPRMPMRPPSPPLRLPSLEKKLIFWVLLPTWRSSWGAIVPPTCIPKNENLGHYPKGAAYKGCQPKTRSGYTCQKWSSQGTDQHFFSISTDVRLRPIQGGWRAAPRPVEFDGRTSGGVSYYCQYQSHIHAQHAASRGSTHAQSMKHME